jgi:hypothetical protein
MTKDQKVVSMVRLMISGSLRRKGFLLIRESDLREELKTRGLLVTDPNNFDDATPLRAELERRGYVIAIRTPRRILRCCAPSWRAAAMW